MMVGSVSVTVRRMRRSLLRRADLMVGCRRSSGRESRSAFWTVAQTPLRTSGFAAMSARICSRSAGIESLLPMPSPRCEFVPRTGGQLLGSNTCEPPSWRFWPPRCCCRWPPAQRRSAESTRGMHLRHGQGRHLVNRHVHKKTPTSFGARCLELFTQTRLRRSASSLPCRATTTPITPATTGPSSACRAAPARLIGGRRGVRMG
jgi:hypothetical protein